MRGPRCNTYYTLHITHYTLHIIQYTVHTAKLERTEITERLTTVRHFNVYRKNLNVNTRYTYQTVFVDHT